MGVGKAFGQGIKTTSHKARVLLYLWVTNFIFSTLLATPFYFLLQQEFSRSLMAEQLGQGFDLLWLGDVIYRFRDFYPAFLGWLLVLGLLFLLVYVFLEGGIVGALVEPGKKVRLNSFLGDSGKYFFRFLRVFLLSLLGYLILFGLVLRAIGLPFRAWEKSAPSELALLISGNLKFLIAMVSFFSLRMIFDYLRIKLVAEDGKKTLQAALAIFSFLHRRFFRAGLLYLLVGIISILLGALFLTVYRLLPHPGTIFLLAFIWQQLYILSRVWTRVMFLATGFHFFSHHQARL